MTSNRIKLWATFDGVSDRNRKNNWMSHISVTMPGQFSVAINGRLIERGLAHELGGEVRISFHPADAICEIDISTVTALIKKVKRKSNGEPIFAERP